MEFATVATLSRSVFEAARESRSISPPGPLRYGVEELNKSDEQTLIAELDKLSIPDDIEDQIDKQAYTRRLSFSSQYLASSSPSFQKSTQGPTTLTAPTIDVIDPSPSFPNELVPSFRVVSNPIFCLEDLAYTKLIVHALKYPRDTVNGLLLGQYSVSHATIDIVDAVPLQHYRTNLSPGYIGEAEVYTMDVGLGMVRFSPRLLLSYVKLSPSFRCEIDYNLRPQSPASCSWILRGAKALR